MAGGTPSVEDQQFTATIMRQTTSLHRGGVQRHLLRVNPGWLPGAAQDMAWSSSAGESYDAGSALYNGQATAARSPMLADRANALDTADPGARQAR